jgi:CheY-like chemotaxis protein
MDKPRCRVLVVEDEAAVSILIEDMLLDFGTEIVGPVARTESALKVAQEADLDLGILDINVAGQTTYSVADVLRGRGIPFVFATGYSTAAVPLRFQGCPLLQKPFTFSTFEEVLRGALAGRPCHREPSLA